MLFKNWNKGCECNRRTTWWKEMLRARDGESAVAFHALARARHPQHLHVFITQALWSLCFCVFLWSLPLHKRHWLNHWPWVIKLIKSVTKRGLLQITRQSLTFWLWSCFRSQRTNDQILQQKMLPLFSSLGNSWGFWELRARNRDEDQTHFFF